MSFANFTNSYRNPVDVPENYWKHPAVACRFRPDGAYLNTLKDPVTLGAIATPPLSREISKKYFIAAPSQSLCLAGSRNHAERQTPPVGHSITQAVPKTPARLGNSQSQ